MQTRQREPELMDDPALDVKEHIHARSGLARLNALSGAAGVLWQALHELAVQQNLKSLRVLDIACGAADVPMRLFRVARRQGFDLQIDGCDFSATALEHARECARIAGAPSKFFQLDVFRDEIPAGYDVVMTSLFTHHLDEDETIKLLASMQRAAGRMVMVSDLQRSQLNLALIWIATRLCSTSRVVQYDGPASVRNSYTLPEFTALADRAGLHGAVVRNIFPCRMMLTWRNDQ